MLNRLDLRGLDNPGDHLPRPSIDEAGPLDSVRAILTEVRSHGDQALRELTSRFDGVELDAIRVPEQQLEQALSESPEEFRRALRLAHDRIAEHHRAQISDPVEHSSDGITVRSSRRAVDRVGCYVPGGLAEYPSTVLMTAVPAIVAGVEQVALCVPPERGSGTVARSSLAAAALAGVHEVYSIGGAQAIAALAYGTESVRPVDVICGPGNKYVALAKQEVAGHVGIAAAFAGPSEVVVIADSTTDPALAAIDVILQAEHGPDGLAWLVTWDESFADAVDERIARIVAESPRRAEISATFGEGGHLALVDSPEAALKVSDRIAPEHLELMCQGASAMATQVRNAGAIFVGQWSPASIGDYVAGPSHVLPTHGSARFSSALTVDDFLKHHHVIEVDPAVYEAGAARSDEPAGSAGSMTVADAAAVIAEAEGLGAHAESIRIRQRLVNGTAAHLYADREDGAR